MLVKLILTFLLTSQIFMPQTNQNSGVILGVQEAGDKAGTAQLVPQRINPKNLSVEISAKSAVVVDRQSGQILFDKQAQAVRSIASITKLTTVLTFLDTNPDFDQVVKITAADMTGAGSLNLMVGEEVTIKDLLYLSLVNSDNNATLALVHATQMTEEEFVKKMNLKTKGMGLLNTKFVDAVGLDKNNVATAWEVTKILDVVSRHALIKEILLVAGYDFVSVSGKSHHIKNTNKLLNSYLNILAGKTGFIDEAGYCFTSLIKLKNGHEILTAVLGSTTADNRFQDTKAIVNWVENNYQW